MGWGASGFLFIRGTALRILKVNARLSRLQGNDPEERQQIHGHHPPIWLNSAWKCTNAAKVRGAGTARNARTEKIARARRVCGSPRRRTRLRARTPSPPGGGASAAAGEPWVALRGRPAPGKGDSGRGAGGPGNSPPHCTGHNLPRISCPCWRPPASLYSQLPNSWWLFQRRVSQCSTNATCKRSSNPEGSPRCRGLPLGPQVKVSYLGVGARIRANAAQK